MGWKSQEECGGIAGKKFKIEYKGKQIHMNTFFFSFNLHSAKNKACFIIKGAEWTWIIRIWILLYLSWAPPNIYILKSLYKNTASEIPVNFISAFLLISKTKKKKITLEWLRYKIKIFWSNKRSPISGFFLWRVIQPQQKISSLCHQLSSPHLLGTQKTCTSFFFFLFLLQLYIMMND